MVHGRSSLMESLVWLLPFLCVDRSSLVGSFVWLLPFLCVQRKKRRESVNSQNLRNFPSGSLGGRVGLLLCCVRLSFTWFVCCLIRPKSSADSTRFSGVCGNAHRVQGSSAETPSLVVVMPWTSHWGSFVCWCCKATSTLGRLGWR